MMGSIAAMKEKNQKRVRQAPGVAAKAIFVGLSLLFSCLLANANEVVFTDGSTKILLNDKQDKMFCTYCGFGDQMKSIAGPIPVFGGVSGVNNYFKEQLVIIVWTDGGTSCPSGQYTAIDLRTRMSKDLDLPNCGEAKATYTSEKGKAIMRVKQGKKVTTFTF